MAKNVNLQHVKKETDSHRSFEIEILYNVFCYVGHQRVRYPFSQTILNDFTCVPVNTTDNLIIILVFLQTITHVNNQSLQKLSEVKPYLSK